MKFFNFGTPKTANAETAVHPTNNGIWGMFGLTRGSRFNYAGKVGDGHDASVLMAPVTWIMENAAQAPLQVEDLIKERWLVNAEHDLTTLLDTPNQEYSGDQLIMGTIVCLLTSVDAYWLIIRDNTGKPSELWLLPSHLVTPMVRPGSGGFIDYYEYRPGGEHKEYDPEDIVHFRIGIDPNDVRHGLSPLASILREVFTDVEAANFTSALLRNMGIPGVVISPKGETTITNTDSVVKKFMQKFTGDKRGEPMVNSVPTDVQTFGFNPDEMAVEKLRNISEERVCAALHVKPSTIGFGTGLQQTKVGATAREERKSSWQDGVLPLLLIIAKTGTRKLVPQFGGKPRAQRVRPDLSEVEALQESRDATTKRVIQKVNAGIQTVADGQAELGDEVDESQRIYLRASNKIEVPASVKSAGVTISELTAAAKTLLLGGTKAAPTTEQAQLMARFTRDTRALEPAFEREMLALLTDWAGKVADSADRVLNDKQLAESQLILDNVDLIAMDADVKALYEAQYVRTAEATTESINSIMGVSIGRPDVIAQQIVALGGRQAGLLDLSGSVRKDLFKILNDAQVGGFGIPETTRMIRDTVTAGRFSSPTIRARLIARTEILHAQRESSLAAYRQIPNVNNVMVFDARLGETDEECANLDGTIVPMAEAEILSAEEHPNGTRAFAPQVTTEN